MPDNVEDIRRKDIPAYDGQIRRRIFRGWFFNHVGNLEKSVLNFCAFYHTIVLGLVLGHLFYCDDRTLVLIEQIDHLLEDTGTVGTKIVRQQHGKGVVTYQRFAR